MKYVTWVILLIGFCYFDLYSQREMLRIYGKDTSIVNYPLNQVDSIIHYTIQKGSVITTGPASITGQSAYCGGKVISDGMGTISEVGLCWSVKSNPTITNAKTKCDLTDSSFNCIIAGLNRSSTYYVRAYMINEAGVSYGNEVIVNTSSNGGTLIHQGYEYNTFLGCDGNEWLQENLKSVVFQNGDSIKQVNSFTEIKEAFDNKIPAWCYYGFDEKNDSVYGKLYNYWAVMDKRNLEPFGWNISNISLLDCLGGDTLAGGKMKTIGTLENGDGYWYSPNIDASNISGFSGQPGGMATADPSFSPKGFYGLNEIGNWWIVYYPNDSKSIYTNSALLVLWSGMGIVSSGHDKKSLASVRCVKKK
jgi:uncharacterized protein (TIGR02145 family)